MTSWVQSLPSCQIATPSGTRPMCFRGLRLGIMGGDRKSDLVGCRGNQMIDNHTVLHGATQLHRLLIVAQRNGWC